MKWLRVSAAALACLAAAKAQSITGRWVGNGSTVDNAMEIVVALNQGADGKIAGYVIGRSQDVITDGKVEDGKITLEAERPGRNGAVQKVTYTAVVENGKLKLTMPVIPPRAPARAPATGATPAAAAPPRAPRP